LFHPEQTKEEGKMSMSNGRAPMTEGQALVAVGQFAKDAIRKLRTKRTPTDTEMHALFAGLQAIEIFDAVASRFAASEEVK
jgi:hypothetical protein